MPDHKRFELERTWIRFQAIRREHTLGARIYIHSPGKEEPERLDLSLRLAGRPSPEEIDADLDYLLARFRALLAQ